MMKMRKYALPVMIALCLLATCCLVCSSTTDTRFYQYADVDTTIKGNSTSDGLNTDYAGVTNMVWQAIVADSTTTNLSSAIQYVSDDKCIFGDSNSVTAADLQWLDLRLNNSDATTIQNITTNVIIGGANHTINYIGWQNMTALNETTLETTATELTYNQTAVNTLTYYGTNGTAEADVDKTIRIGSVQLVNMTGVKPANVYTGVRQTVSNIGYANVDGGNTTLFGNFTQVVVQELAQEMNEWVSS